MALLALVPSARVPATPATRPAAGKAPASRPARDPSTLGNFANLHLEEDSLRDIELFNLEVPTIVTAGRRTQKITELPYAVSVITAADIRAAGARNVPDALRLVPGVDVADLALESIAVSPRGFHGITSCRTLILVDGRQLFDPLAGVSVWAGWPFPLEEIERIEVVRGPGSVTWGANATSGVINIVTRDPGDKPGLTLHGRAGSRGTHEEYAGYAFKLDRLRLRVSGGYESSDGFASGGSFLRPIDDDFNSPQMNLTGVYDAGPNDKVSFSAGSRTTEGGLPPGPSAGFHVINPGSQGNFLLGRWEHKIALDNVLTFTGYVNDALLHASQVIDYRSQQLALQMSHTLKPAENHTLIWGVDTRVELLDATNADPWLLAKRRVSTPTIGLYAQDDWQFAPRWLFSLGGRVDYDAYAGFNPSGRAALAYELAPDASIYGAVSQAYKLIPSAGRFLDAPLAGGVVRLETDRDFTATRQVAYELGYRGRFFDRLDVAANLFWHETDDETLYQHRLGPPGLMRMNLDNGASASIYGIELEGKYQVNEKLTLLAYYDLEVLDWRGPEFTGATDNISPPRHKAMLGARYSPLTNLYFSAHAYYVGHTTSPNISYPLPPRCVDSYLRLDLRGQYDFWNNRAFFAVGVRNLLDPHHLEGTSAFINDAEVPRMVYAEIGIRLDR